MLHDPSHITPTQVAEEILLGSGDKDILKLLGEEIAHIASLPVHKEKSELWKKMNDLDSVRPMVWINEIPWNEMNVNDELTLKCEHKWAMEFMKFYVNQSGAWLILPNPQ